jgi:RNA polymerase sigma-70 factor (ECF subfamily)
MTEQDSFTDLIRRVRAGDQRAAADLVRQYEAAVRVEAHRRIEDVHLRRLLDSMDVCQSVLGSFFVGAAAGRYHLERPAQLRNLLAAIVRNKVAFHARKEQAQRRDRRRVEATPVDKLEVADRAPGPSRVLAAREQLHEVLRRLTNDERRLADLRAQGRAWADIAAEVGGTPAARRMQLSRAIERVSRELGLDAGSFGWAR